ncbi:integrase catalytic domain-containing protein [Saccharospirillum mangrovi]|uniref:integrase catalytic domain-containing protein n=1 Tax=Saccharospirillum mangrovi TaxID=2161747 RepID=UPI000D361318|nr:DDE-type integrase/transposase/recombinase [Saccharospirillum mangrovi]
MSDIDWLVGTIVEFSNSEPCHRAIIRSANKEIVALASITNGEIYKLSVETLYDLKEGEKLKLLTETKNLGELAFIDLKDQEQTYVSRRLRYLNRIYDNDITKITPNTAIQVIEEVALELNEKAPHWQTVRNWHNAYTKSGSKLKSLYPKNRYRGYREDRLDPRVIKIIEKESKKYYRDSQPSIASMERNVEAKIIEHNLKNPYDTLAKPTYKTIQLRIDKALYQDKIRSRKGESQLRKELLGTTSGIETERILERVEIDHTPLDIDVLHDVHKTLLGKPFLTVLIDHYSHMVLGYLLSFENPSFSSVCVACLNSFLPKGDFTESIGTLGEWPAHGIPSVLATDNGNEFWGNEFVNVADEIGTILQYCKIRRGNEKSRVERFFGIVNTTVLDDLPGVTRKVDRKAESYNAGQDAKLTFSEFKTYLAKWIVDVYHNTPLSKSGQTPNEIWTESETHFPVAEESQQDLLPALLSTTIRRLNPGGSISIFSMTYSSEILKDIYRRDGPKDMTVKSNKFDLGSILVLDKTNNIYIEVFCDNYSYAAGLSYFEHKKVLHEIRKKKQNSNDSLVLQTAKVQLANEREAMHKKNFRRKTQTTTTNAARAEKIGIDNVIQFGRISTLSVDQDNEIDDDLTLEGWSID